MSQIVDAIFDGAVLRPETLLPLQPNTRVRLTVEILPPESPSASFLDMARSLNLTGPSDWATNLDKYLYDDKTGDEAFLDTSYAVALSASSDVLHGRALALAVELERSQTRMVTTRAVLLEIGNALARERYRSAAIQLLATLERDLLVEIVPLSEELYARAIQLYSSRPDKEWGLIDCVSFVVMSERAMTIALTADIHFQQCGFRALLREDEA